MRYAAIIRRSIFNIGKVLLMKDSTRESLSYFGLYAKMLRVKKEITPQAVSFGSDKQQYFLYYEPKHSKSDKVIIWVHGGGWNAGTPKLFDFVGQCIAKYLSGCTVIRPSLLQ